jgi:hypothetical protein
MHCEAAAVHCKKNAAQARMLFWQSPSLAASKECR